MRASAHPAIEPRLAYYFRQFRARHAMSQVSIIQRHLERLPSAMQDEVLDFVLFLEQRAASGKHTDASARERAQRVGAALESLAMMNPFEGVDPCEWQRNARSDRPMGARE